MIVDSSALVALMTGEPDASAYALAITSTDGARMSVANWLEVAIVVERRAGTAAEQRRLDELRHELRLELVPVGLDHAEIARQAYREYGRGSGHPARLNYGDCFAYALAVAAREPLLFKGDDFIHTDLTPAEVPHS